MAYGVFLAAGVVVGGRLVLARRVGSGRQKGIAKKEHDAAASLSWLTADETGRMRG